MARNHATIARHNRQSTSTLRLAEYLAAYTGKPERPAGTRHGRIKGFPGDPSMTATTLPQAASHPFRLTEEQEQLRREIRTFAAKEIAPHVMEWDEVSEFPSAVVKQLGQMGLLGMLMPDRKSVV